MADHATEQAAQDVTAAEVAGGDAITDQLGHRAAVVPDHLQRGLAFGVELLVVDPGQTGCGLDQRIDEVGLVVVRNLLQDLGHPLEAHPGVDVAVLQRREAALSVAVVLHEHQVVELDEAAVVLEVDALIAQFGLEVVIDLRARAARAGWTGGPEVVGLIHPDDPLGVHPHHIAPDLLGFVVLAEDTDHQVLGADAKHRGAQLPSPLDGLLLEVVTEGEVPEHLEERVVPRRAPHVFDVVGANALLAAGRAGRRPGLLAEKDRLKRQHPGDGQQNRRVLRHQGGTGHRLMAPLLVEVQEGRTDLSTSAGSGGHGEAKRA